MNFKLGKKPARPGAVQLRFGSYFNASELPKPPPVIGRPWMVRSWGMLGNDSIGDCVFAGAAHETMMLCADASSTVPTFTSKTTVADYSAVTGYNPDDPNSDVGTDAQVAAAYRQKVGVADILGARHKIDVYTAMRVGDMDELALAVYLLGIAGIGVLLPDSAETQFDHAEVWDVVPGAGVAGGHYICCIGRNSVGNFVVVTWGRLQAVTPRWLATYMDEGIAYLSRERLNSAGLSPQGYDAAKLNDDFTQITA